jgi:hypothetical protein
MTGTTLSQYTHNYRSERLLRSMLTLRSTLALIGLSKLHNKEAFWNLIDTHNVQRIWQMCWSRGGRLLSAFLSYFGATTDPQTHPIFTKAFWWYK